MENQNTQITRNSYPYVNKFLEKGRLWTRESESHRFKIWCSMDGEGPEAEVMMVDDNDASSPAIRMWVVHVRVSSWCCLIQCNVFLRLCLENSNKVCLRARSDWRVHYKTDCHSGFKGKTSTRTIHTAITINNYIGRQIFYFSGLQIQTSFIDN